MGVYLRPDSLADALDALSASPCGILAGGTDFYPARVGQPLDDDVLDLTGIRELRGITEQDGFWRIGALTTWTDVRRTRLPPLFDSLKQAAREVGGLQIQNAGTVAGNLCNASPAADGVPPLMALDAEVELASGRGTRRLALGDFILGNRRTDRAPDEILTAIRLPKRGEDTASRFLKLGARKYLVISIVMVAITLEAEEGRAAGVSVAVGACSPVARRLPNLEADLAGSPLADLAGRVRSDQVGAAIEPIDDVRGTADYRRDAAVTLIRRGLAELAAEAGARS